MPGKFSKRLVIDSDVVQSAGGAESGNPTSKNCRDFLQTALEVCHRVVITTEISAEWKKHWSRFSRKWLKEMYGRKKVEDDLTISENTRLRKRIEKQSSFSEKDRQAIMKDIFLVEAALATDKIVISREEESRKLFKEASQSLTDLKKVIWVNPDKDEEQPLRWLGEGAKPDLGRSLGFRGQNL